MPVLCLVVHALDPNSAVVLSFARYFVPEDWSEEDGGQLDLYDCDPDTGDPREVVRSLVPVSFKRALRVVLQISGNLLGSRGKTVCLLLFQVNPIVAAVPSVGIARWFRSIQAAFELCSSGMG